MSVDLLYSDNRPCGERVSQLNVNRKVPDALKNHGLKSEADLRKKSKNTMPDDARKKYESLVTNGITAQTLCCFGDIYSQYISSMYSIVSSMTVKGVESLDKVIHALIDSTCNDMKTNLEHLTFDTVHSYLASLDKDQPPAYKGDNAEPDKAALKTWWDSGKVPDFRYKGKVPKQD